MLAAPFSMSIVVTKESKKLNETFGIRASYVYELCDCYDHDTWDNGDNTMQCTRRPDIIKIWFMWKAKVSASQSRLVNTSFILTAFPHVLQGCKGLGNQIDGTYENTRICVDELKKRTGRFVTLLDEFDSNLVSFYYIPEPVREKLETPDRMVEFLKDYKVCCS